MLHTILIFAIWNIPLLLTISMGFKTIEQKFNFNQQTYTFTRMMSMVGFPLLGLKYIHKQILQCLWLHILIICILSANWNNKSPIPIYLVSLLHSISSLRILILFFSVNFITLFLFLIWKQNKTYVRNNNKNVYGVKI